MEDAVRKSKILEMDIPVAIPTYNRSLTISIQTLLFLRLEQYPSHLITLFVADSEQARIYERDVPKSLYGQIVVGVKGLAAQRNFISDFYPEGQILLQLDDDVNGVKSMGNQSLKELLSRGKDCLHGCGLWGILPNDDGRRFTLATTEHLTHIIGSFFLIRNHKDIRITVEEGEDYERSILYFNRYGRVCRYRGAGVKTTFNKGSGGLITEDREQRRRAGMDYLVSRYPKACSRIMKKDKVDVRLKWKYSIETEPQQDEAQPCASPHTSS